MAETKEELKRILMKVKEESEKAGLTFKKQRSWHLVLSFHGKLVRKKIQTDRLYLLGHQNHRRCDHSHEIKRCLLLGRKAITNLDKIFKAEILLCQQRPV